MTQGKSMTSSRDPVRVGIVGCGNISDVYLRNCTTRFAALEVVSVADLDSARAQAQARAYDVPKALTVDALLDDDEVEVVLNLTSPSAHYDVTRAALLAGKHVYTEKPLAISPAEGDELAALAVEQGVLLGGAPDTFLGAGIQTSLRLLNEGAIGEPVGAAACFASHGNEHWHPNPAFSYQHGGGPVFNLGPYYLTALVALLGPVRTVAGNARISFPTRTISSQPLAGQTITVETPTFINAVFGFASGPVASFTATYDVWATERPKIEIYGSEGTLSMPDPNRFDGPARLYRRETGAWEEVPLDRGFAGQDRGLGLADLARCVREGGHPRASATLANHMLELMQVTQDAGAIGHTVKLSTTCERPDLFDPATIAMKEQHA